VSGAGELDIRRVVVAVDPGYVVNPDSAEAQVQSCVAYGLTSVLWGEITLKEGRVEQSNFHDYRIMRIAEMPRESRRCSSRAAASGAGWARRRSRRLRPRCARDFRRDRQADPLAAAQEPGTAPRVIG